MKLKAQANYILVDPSQEEPYEERQQPAENSQLSAQNFNANIVANFDD